MFLSFSMIICVWDLSLDPVYCVEMIGFLSAGNTPVAGDVGFSIVRHEKTILCGFLIV